MQPLPVLFPDDLVEAAKDLAAEREIPLGQLIRDLLSAEVERSAVPPVRRSMDERLIASLRQRLGADFSAARDWEDLRIRLAGKGYKLCRAADGLALHRRQDTRLCDTEALGFDYDELVQRFGDELPNHPSKVIPLVA